MVYHAFLHYINHYRRLVTGKLDNIIKRCDRFEEKLGAIEEKLGYIYHNTEERVVHTGLSEVGLAVRQCGGDVVKAIDLLNQTRRAKNRKIKTKAKRKPCPKT